MKGNPYSRILDSMKRQGEMNNEAPLSTGTVVSVDPLSIKYNDVISSSVRCSMPHMDKEIMTLIENDDSISMALKTYLNDFYKSFNLEIGDMVMVQKAGNILYVLGKV